MNEFILIDPALPNAFLRLSDKTLSKNEWLGSPSAVFWKNLDLLLKKAASKTNQITFFINFGPGSYTGLKQSKILAETFCNEKISVYIFHQDDILKLGQYKFFYTPAYKGQFYLAQRDTKGEIKSQLKNISELDEFFNDQKISAKEILTLKNDFRKNEEETFLEDVYTKLTLEELLQISSPYNGQSIIYYRSPQEDYKVSVHD